MKIGITYDLRDEYLRAGYSEEETAEFDRADTIDALDNALTSLGYETERIGNVHRLIEKLSQGYRWDMVFNIAEGLKGIGREAQVPVICDMYGIPYTFSDPLVMSLTLHKAMTKRVVRDIGVPTPDFVLIENEKDIESVCLPFPLFAKPVAEGTGKGITAASKIKTPQELSRLCSELLQTCKQPVLVETYLPGREFTVGILGTGDDARVVGVLEIILLNNAEKDVYSYINKENCEELVLYQPVDDHLSRACQQIALTVWKGLGCCDAGRVDLRADAKGLPHFIEVNPLAGLHPAHSDLPILCSTVGMSYRELISSIMDSALKRTNLTHETDLPHFKQLEHALT
jgi:D-alanine-D-alanine ligase